MQIYCYNCRNVLTVSPAGGEFRCPFCGAINAVGAPVATPVQPQYNQPTQRKDQRKELVVCAFLVPGIVALFVGWWGIALGLALLGWAVAGALGKIKGPINLIYPESTRKRLLSVAGVGLGSFVTVCGVAGGVVRHELAESHAREMQEDAELEALAEEQRKKREAAQAVAKAAHEAELKAAAEKAAEEIGAALDAVDTLVAESKWTEAEAKMRGVARAVDEYRKLDPVPAKIAALLPRHDALAAELDVKRREREAVAWIENAKAVVSDRAKCEDKSEVEAARKQVRGLQKSDASYSEVQALNAKLDECLENMPPASKWHYDVRTDPMGGVVMTAAVQSSNSFKFDFPYEGEQHATLLVRNDDGFDVILSIERGQFICTLGCSVMVRFDQDAPQRWRAVGPSDHSSEVIFLRSEAKFVKQLKGAKVVRIEADFYQEGTRVMEFPVARFDASRIK